MRGLRLGGVVVAMLVASGAIGCGDDNNARLRSELTQCRAELATAKRTMDRAMADAYPAPPNPGGGAVPGIPAGPPAHPAASAPVWQYTDGVDELRGQPIKVACLQATNEFHLSSPYESSFPEICVRQHPRMGFDVYISIREGQILCTSYEGCSLETSFDGGEIERVRATGPADNSSNMVFIRSAQEFFRKARRSNRVAVALTIYQDGTQTAVFSGFNAINWEDAAPTKIRRSAPGVDPSNGLPVQAPGFN